MVEIKAPVGSLVTVGTPTPGNNIYLVLDKRNVRWLGTVKSYNRYGEGRGFSEYTVEHEETIKNLQIFVEPPIMVDDTRSYLEAITNKELGGS